MAEYIVKLEDGVWLADGDGDPPRTIVRHNANRFITLYAAGRALAKAQRIQPFRSAAIETADRILEEPE